MSNEKMKTIWAVEDGEYSDYHIVGVFSTKENAELIAERVGGDVVEWRLDPAVNELRQGLTQWQVQMLRDGEVEKVWQLDPSPYNLDTDYSDADRVICRRSRAPYFQGTGTPDCLNVTIWAKTEKGAIKRANEIRTQLIVSNQWRG